MEKVLNCAIIEVNYLKSSALPIHLIGGLAMNKRFHLVSIVTGNLLTIGAIFIYAMQSQVGVALSTYALVMGFFSTLLVVFFYIWGEEKQQVSNRFLK